MIRALLETGFLVSLNPKDRNHEWAVNLLERARKREIKVFISPASLIELSLILKSKGLSDEGVSRVFTAMDSLIKRYARPTFPDLTFETVSCAAKLRNEYPHLSFFDSLHAAVALMEDLEYYDLDEAIRDVIKHERG